MMQFDFFKQEDEPSSLRPLRPIQEKAIESIREAVKDGHKRIVLQAPCGFGKTLLSAHLVTSSVSKNCRPLFTCPAINLVNQTLKAFEAEGIRDIGIIQAQHERTDWNAQVQIASVQTLVRRALPEVDLVIIDEVHQNYEKLNEILDSEAWKEKVVVGLSATPWARGMGRRWTKLIIAATTKEMIKLGYLSPFIVYWPDEDADFSKLRIEKGEFTEASSEAVMGDKKIVADVVKTWLERGENLPTFLFAVNRAHAQNLRNEFQDSGVSCGYIDCFSDDEDRKRTFRRFRSGEDKIIASVGCLTTGVDEDVRVIIDAAPTNSEIRHVQKIGRGLRMAYGKTELIILDHAGNNHRLGLVTDIIHKSLDTRKPGDKKEAFVGEKPVPKPSKCKKCHTLIPSGQKSCPRCGEKLIVDSGVETKPGELVLMGSESGHEKKEKPATHEDKQEWYSGLLGLARERGYSNGWAAHKYKEKFGVWPRNLEDVATQPSYDVRRFETYCRIKWAKSQKKGENK
jgi:DNA repair protein RadD